MRESLYFSCTIISCKLIYKHILSLLIVTQEVIYMSNVVKRINIVSLTNGKGV